MCSASALAPHSTLFALLQSVSPLLEKDFGNCIMNANGTVGTCTVAFDSVSVQCMFGSISRDMPTNVALATVADPTSYPFFGHNDYELSWKAKSDVVTR